MFTITVGLSGTRRTVKETLASREIFVGRSKKCQVVLPEETVSGVHCRLVAIEGGALVLDEGSTNGTWLNGLPVVRPMLVTAEDELRVGPYLLTVQSLIGGVQAARPKRNEEYPWPSEDSVDGEPIPSAPRPQTNEAPTDVQVPQALLFWRLLGFQEGATLEEARAAYQTLAAQHHPDRVAQLNPQLRAEAEQRLREIEFAWQYIQRLCQKAQQEREAAA
ncbi:FHA domain-containing protein [Hyalangium rubrum]|uniref:FHA domain-containing protein n=1 Tax=Hyalangium rubrum TaxID=3103134 RepID=A0ABU5GV66_9BACT|nr:FHA domain-containing protein [Hyalangium sp. s54d21]MDY7225060.1 FHA domain-containing protein [Hyalangium sp. s54d21]